MFQASVNKWVAEMAYQGFSPKLRLAMDIAKAKGATALPIDHDEKARRKQVVKARAEKRLAENLAQRALVQIRRWG
jgi:hypothetical protein